MSADSALVSRVGRPTATVVTYDLEKSRLMYNLWWRAADESVTGPICMKFTKVTLPIARVTYYRDGQVAPFFPGHGGITIFSVIVTEDNMKALEDWLQYRGADSSARKLRAMFPEYFYDDPNALHRRIACLVARIL